MRTHQYCCSGQLRRHDPALASPDAVRVERVHDRRPEQLERVRIAREREQAQLRVRQLALENERHRTVREPERHTLHHVCLAPRASVTRSHVRTHARTQYVHSRISSTMARASCHSETWRECESLSASLTDSSSDSESESLSGTGSRSGAPSLWLYTCSVIRAGAPDDVSRDALTLIAAATRVILEFVKEDEIEQR